MTLMKWFYIEVTDSHGEEYHDECRASNERDAREAIAGLGYSIKTIRLKRLKTWIASVPLHVYYVVYGKLLTYQLRYQLRQQLMHGMKDRSSANDNDNSIPRRTKR